MKVKLTVSRAGIDFAQSAGDVVDVDDREGLALIESGQGEAIYDKEYQRALKLRDDADAAERAAFQKAADEERQAQIDAYLIEVEVAKARALAEANIVELRAAAAADEE